ncbi:MAG: PAS domain-containing protein [Cyanobacteria bacterium CRU_2_1]|nr:PAS domain-containing protein [Cyanobacteria bacterium CRU_2_1]
MAFLPQVFAIGLLGYLSFTGEHQTTTVAVCSIASGLAIALSFFITRHVIQSTLQKHRQCIQTLKREIDERRQIEAALNKSQASLAAIQRVAYVGSWEFNINTQIGVWSEGLFRIYGLDPNQPKLTYAELLEQVIHPDDRAVLQQRIEQSIADHAPFEVDLRIFHPDGTLRFVESRGEPIFDHQGRLLQLIGTD